MKISLRPYPGDVIVCKTRKAFVREHKALFGNDDHGLKDSNNGRMVGKWCDKAQWPTYIVWGCDTARLAHELSHVILHVFELAGIDPREAGGEPFCYLLSQLLLDAKQ